MSSGSHPRNYPPLLYAKGKAPSQQKSMSYYSYMSNFQMVKQGVGDDAWDQMKASSIGVLIRFYELDIDNMSPGGGRTAGGKHNVVATFSGTGVGASLGIIEEE